MPVGADPRHEKALAAISVLLFLAVAWGTALLLFVSMQRIGCSAWEQCTTGHWYDYRVPIRIRE